MTEFRRFSCFFLLFCGFLVIPLHSAQAAISFLRTFKTGVSGPAAIYVTNGGVDLGGNLYVACYGSSSFKEYDSSGNQIFTVSTGGVTFPAGIAVDSNGKYYVPDGTSHLLRFNSDGTGKTTFISPGSPYDVAIDSSTGNILIANGTQHNVKIYDSTGTTLLSTRTATSTSQGNTFGVVSDNNGNFYATDFSNGKIIYFTSSTDSVFATGLTNPQGIRLDAQGNVYVAEAGGNRIKKFDPTGTLLATSSVLNTPRGLFVDSNNRIYVGETGANRIQILTQGPLRPISLSATPSGTSVNLSWTNPTDATYASTTIVRKTTGYPTSTSDGTVVTSGITSTSYSDPGLSDGTYYYGIFSVDTNGAYSPPNTISVVLNDPPGAPTSFLATASGSNVSLSWTNPTDSDFASVTIRRSTSTYPTSVTDGTSVTSGLSGTSYADNSLTDGDYYYSLFALDAAGNVSASTNFLMVLDTTPPNSPSLSASRTGSTVNLNWNVPATTDTFMLRRGTSGYPTSSTGTAVLASTPASTTDYADTNLSDGTYYYSLFAIDSAGNVSSAGTSAVITVDTTAPTPPTYFAGVVSGHNINLSWINPLDSDFASVTLRKSTTSTPLTISSGSMLAQNLTGTTLSDTGLADGNHYYSLFALDTAGNVSARTDILVILDTTAPAAVSSLTAEVSGTSVTLHWINPGDADLDSIVIRRSDMDFPIDSVSDVLVAEDVVATSFEDADLPLGTYYYSLFALDTTGNASAAANILVVTEGHTPTVATGDAGEIDKSAAFLNGNVTDVGSSAVTVRGFEIGETTDYGSTAQEEGDFEVGEFGLDALGLDCGTTYHYRAFATNETGTVYGEDKTFATSACDPHRVVTVQAPTDPVQINSTTTFVVTLNNSGSSDINDTVLAFTLSDNIVFVSAEAIVTSDASENVVNASISQSLSCSGTDPVSCTIGTIPANSSVALNITVRALSTGPMSLVVDTGDDELSGGSATTGEDGGAVDTLAFSGGTISCALIKESSETLR